MDAACTIQDSIHVFSLVRKYVSRILGTYQIRRGEIISVTYAFFFAKRVLNTNHSSVAIQIEE